MLVLSRHIDESIMIGDDISVMVVNIIGDKVRLGINAPIDIPIHRKEVYEAIQRDIQRESEKAKSKLETNVGQISDTQTPNQQTLYQRLRNYLPFHKSQKYNK